MAGIASLALAYVLSQFYRSFLAVLTPALIDELGATKADLSTASGAWFIAFALAQFAVGMSLDRWGPRLTGGLLLGVCGAGGAFLFAAASSTWMVTLAMTLIGLGCAPVLMAAVYIFARSWSPGRLAVLTSWLVAFGTAGNVIGAAPLAAAAEAFGWRAVMTGLGVITLAVALALLAFVRDPERYDDPQRDGTGLSGYLELLRIKQIWLLAPLIAMNYTPTAGIRGLWAGPFLADIYGLDVIAIGQVTLFMALAMVVGAFAYGPLDTFFGTRKWVAVAGNGLLLATLCLLSAHPAPDLTTLTLIFVAIGLFGGSYGLLMAHGRAFLPPHLTGRGMTLLNFFSIGGVGLGQFATGAVYSANVDPAMPVAGYQALWIFYAAALGLTLFVYLFARDARPESPAREITAGAR
jgi:MFS family permease